MQLQLRSGTLTATTHFATSAFAVKVRDLNRNDTFSKSAFAVKLRHLNRNDTFSKSAFAVKRLDANVLCGRAGACGILAVKHALKKQTKRILVWGG